MVNSESNDGDGSGSSRASSLDPSSLWRQQKDFNISVAIHQTDIVHLYSKLLGEVDDLRARIADLEEAVHILDLANTRRARE